MSQEIFAVLAVVPGEATPQFTLVKADEPADALAAAAEQYVQADKQDAQLVAVFRKEDLLQVADMMESAGR